MNPGHLACAIRFVVVDVLQLLSDTDRRGPQVAAVELAVALRALGMTVEVAALRHGASDTTLDVPVHGWRETRRVARGARVVLAQGSTSLWGAIAATEATPRGFVYRSIGDTAAWATTRGRRMRVRAGLRRARAVVALWPEAATNLATLYGLATERIAVIPQAAAAERFPPIDAAERRTARRALLLGDDDVVAIYVGALSAEKRVDLAIDAAARAGVTLLVAGDGPLRGSLEARAAGSGAAVTFLGAVDDVPSVLAAADVLVLASRTEGIPAALIEAGLRGLPVVATRVGGVPFVVEDGVTGILVETDDVGALQRGIELALADPSLGTRARSRCLEDFSLDAVADRWRVVLERAMCA